MAQQQTIPQIIIIGELSQYIAGNAVAKSNAFQGGSITPNISPILYMERKAVQWSYINNSGDSALQGKANYLYSLYGLFGLQALNRLNQLTQAPPLITNPQSLSLVVGQTANFLVTVTSSIAYTIQWYRNGVPIAGATSASYSLTNVQLSDSGAQFSATATNAAGSVSSASATLTVTNQIVGFFYYGASDPFPTLQSNSDPFTYQVQYNITHNANIVVTMPTASSPNEYLIVKVPIGEPIKTTWFNDNFNNGNFPDANWQAVLQFGGYAYYCSRLSLSLNTSQTLILS